MASKINSLQARKREIQLELNELLHASNPDNDKINELRAEILYIEKQIEKIVGKKEIDRLSEVRRNQIGIDEISKRNYFALKEKFKKISPMAIATNRIVNLIDRLTKNQSEEKVRVKI